MIKKLQVLLPPIALFALSLIVHAVPFIRSGWHPLGYDTGFYRRYLIEPFASFPNTPVPGLGEDALIPRLLLDILRLAHLPTDVALYGSYMLFFACLPVLFFFFLKPFLETRGAFIAAVLLILSPVQYTEYWYMLWKNAFALCLLVSAFTLIEKEKFWWVFALDILIALSHKTTALIYIATIGILFLFWKGRRREMFFHGALTGACLTLVAFPLVHKVSLALPTAVFLDWQTYVWFSLPLLCVVGFGFLDLKEKKVPYTLLAFTVVSFSFPLFHLPFYERIFVYSDIALIALAAYAVELLIVRVNGTFSARALTALGVLCLGIGLWAGGLITQMRELSPLMNKNDIARIEAIAQKVPSNATILTTSDEAPWYEGWTLVHIAAPGMLHDNHNLEAWTAFWDATSTAERVSFLNDFQTPLYISTLADFTTLVGNPTPCLVPVAPDLLYDTCAERK